MVEFRLLGDLEVRAGEQVVAVGHARQRHVLAVLLAEANRVVPVGQLAERVWGEQRLPADPDGTLRTYVSLLRRALAPVSDMTIARQADGYKAVVDTGTIDLHRFRELVARAGAASDEESAAALLEQALGLWRGEPFTGLTSPWADDVRAALDLEYRAASLDHTDIQLRRGQHAALLARLAARAAEQPLDERLAGQYMLALYRDGRAADALAWYRQVRRHLTEELGTDPGPPLRQLHQQILAADPGLALPGAQASLAGRPAVPRQLPRPPWSFTGRAAELTRLTAAVDGQEPGDPVVISVIGGSGGIGKTWLALHWAHQHLDRFPDGQLWVNLRGFDPSGEPMPAEAALRGILDALGVGPAAVPPDLDAQAGLYRSLLAGKRMLVVLDNARDTGQVVPLLPASPACTVLVTSRRQLTGLVTAHGARSLDLDVLDDREAREVLERHLGATRLAAEPDAVADLLACCAGLPLALALTAARAAVHAAFPLAALAAELRDAAARLDALEAGDGTASVRVVLSWSYRALAGAAAAVLGLLGLAPGPDISLPAAASLTGLPISRARAVLRELEAASLIHEHQPGRYRMHDLIRLHAAEQAHRDQPQQQRVAALRRVLDFYLHTAYAGDRLVVPHRETIDIGRPATRCIPREPPDAAAAVTWFHTEQACLLAAQNLAAAQGWHAYTWQLAWVLDTLVDFGGHVREQITIWQAGLTAADHLGQPAIQAAARRHLGHAHARAGHYAESLDHLNHAIALAERAGDTARQAHGHLGLGRVWDIQGDHLQALDHATRALRLYQALGHRVWEADGLNAVGWCHTRLGHHEQARACCEAALALYRGHRDREGEANTLDSLGYITVTAGHHAEAAGCYGLAATIYRDLGKTYAEADALDGLAGAHAARGDHDEAHRVWQQALELYRTQYRFADVVRIRQHLVALGPLSQVREMPDG